MQPDVLADLLLRARYTDALYTLHDTCARMGCDEVWLARKRRGWRIMSASSGGRRVKPRRSVRWAIQEAAHNVGRFRIDERPHYMRIRKIERPGPNNEAAVGLLATMDRAREFLAHRTDLHAVHGRVVSGHLQLEVEPPDAGVDAARLQVTVQGTPPPLASFTVTHEGVLHALEPGLLQRLWTLPYPPGYRDTMSA